MPTSFRTLALVAALGLASAGCAATDPAHRYDAADAQMQRARDAVHRMVLDGQKRLDDAVRRSDEATAAYKRTADRAFAATREDMRRHPERYRGPAAPRSPDYERVLSGQDDRLDDAERGYARDRARGDLDRHADDMEWQIERGQIETRYGIE